MPIIEIPITSYLFEMSILIGEFTFIISLILGTYRVNKNHGVWWNIGMSVAHICILFVVTNLISICQYYIEGKGYRDWSFYVRYLFAALIYLIPLFNSKHKFIARSCIVLMLYGMHFLLGELGSCVPVLLRESTYGKQWDTILRNTISATLILFAWFLRHYSLTKIKKLPITAVIFIAIISLLEIGLFIYVSYLTSFNSDAKTATIKLVFSIYIVVLYYFSYYLIYKICVGNEDKVQLQAENYELTKNNELMMISDEYYGKLRAMKHDAKNQYGYMKVLIQEKKFDELVEFFNQYGDGTLEAISFITSNNSMIDSILNMEYAKARANNIEFDIKIAVPDTLPILSTDLSSLLTNIIDNALEACLYYKIEKPVVTIRIRKYEDFLLIDVTNPVPKVLTMDQIKKIRTTKPQNDIHGFGHIIIKRIINEYDGTLERTCEDGLFNLKAMLSCNKED